jgi:hypothetical protein
MEADWLQLSPAYPETDHIIYQKNSLMKIKSQYREPVQNNSLVFILQEIVQMTDPEKIFLLSASYNYQITENIFIKNPVKEFSNSRYELLLLSDAPGGKSMAG